MNIDDNSATINDEKPSDVPIEHSTEKQAEKSVSDVKVIDTSKGKKDGQSKCPSCGSTDICLDVVTGKLRCNFCRYEYSAAPADFINDDIDQLEGICIGSGAKEIDQDTESTVTIKCTSCGAEVVVDTNDSMSARCHWCRNTLSVNEQIPNGAVPDAVLPFCVKREEAQKSISDFVGHRKFFAHPSFKKEFTTDNIMGLYLPYMVVDMNAHADFSGQAEKLKRKYSVTIGKSQETRYDADLYWVERHFDISVNDLTVESSEDKLKANNIKTNNIINAIMPFDTENCVCWDANYLRGFSSEKRDIDVDSLKDLATTQGQDIARYKAKEDMAEYDRGTNWQNQQFDIKGQRWVSAYLPVWLYSYQQKKSNGEDLLHYVAVNGRTKETMGSVPIHKPRLFAISAIVEIIGIVIGLLGMIFLSSKNKDSNNMFWCVTFLAGFVYYMFIYLRYRNTNARHKHESETKATVRNMERRDDYQDTRKGLRSPNIEGRNDTYASSSLASKFDVKQLVTSQLDKGSIVSEKLGL